MKCPACNETQSIKYLTHVTSVYSTGESRYDIERCPKCQHYFTSPLPTEAELNKIYTHTYSYDAHQLISKEKRFRANK